MADQASTAPAAAPSAPPARTLKPPGRFWLWRRYWLRDPLLGALNFVLYHLARRLPTEWVSDFGAWLGPLQGRYRFHDQRERAIRVYRRLLGAEVGPAEAEAAAMRLFANAGRTMFEFARLDRLWGEGRIAVVGADHLLTARAAGRPVIVMGLHLNNWEVIGPSIIGLGVRELTAIYQPPTNRFEDRLAHAARRRYGVRLLEPGVKAARIARRVLVEDKGVLLVFVDEEREWRVAMPLFRRMIPPRANITTIIRLAWASGAAVIPAYAEREGARHRVTFLPPAELLPECREEPHRLAENVHRLDTIVTPLVRDRLDQWYMLFEYRRG